MIPEPPPTGLRETRGSSVRTIRQRCGAMGAPTWRCDNAGLIIDEPDEPAPLSLLFSTRVFSAAISRVAAQSYTVAAPSVAMIFPGAWGVVLPEVRRRERVGSLVALAMAPEALESELLACACAEATLETTAVRRALLPKARFGQTAANCLRDAMAWMAQDLAQVEESESTIQGFTNQLADCFETIDVLYAMGRSMNDLHHPVEFVERMCRRIQGTLAFGRIGAWFADDELVPPGVRGRMLGCGDAPEPDGLTAELQRFAADPDRGARTGVLTELAGRPIPNCGQVLAHPVVRSGRVVGVIFGCEKGGHDPQVSSYDIQLIEAAAGYVGAFIDNAALYSEQRALFLGTLEALTSSIDAKDRYTSGHSYRVAHLSWQLARAAGLTPEHAERVRIAGLVHDVGKIGVPEAVLTKSGKLSDDEFAAIKKHPEIGHRILKDIPLFGDVLPGVLHHHERWDGRGYPHGLVGEGIPLMARMIALADTFDAMSSNRSYRAAMPRPKVLVEIHRNAGVQFDPTLAKIFVGLNFAEYDRMVARQAEAAGAAPGDVAKAA